MGACAPRVQVFPSLNREPALESQRFVGSDGVERALSVWGEVDGPGDQPIILALHGFNDYRHAFEIPSGQMLESGLMIVAFDQRGFGSDQYAGIWAGNQVMANDVIELARLLHAGAPGRSVFLLGESMGGAVALMAARRDDEDLFDGLILVGPAVWGWSQMNPFYRASLWLGAHIMPSKKLTGGGLDITPSDNDEMLIALSRDPNVIKETRLDAIYGLVGLMDAGLDAAASVSGPVLLLYGGKDEIIPRKAIEALRRRLPTGFSYSEFEGGYHMLLRDHEREIVIDQIIEFVHQHVGDRR